MAYPTMFIFCLLLVTLAARLIAGEIPDVGTKDAVNNDEYNIVRRHESADLTPGDKVAIVDMHNQLRRLSMASNMLKMEWDLVLEKSAQNWTNEHCYMMHSPDAFRKSIPGYRYVGENSAGKSEYFSPASAVQRWYNEVKFYDYDTRSCSAGEMCGHYTQVVWANSKAVGCAMRYCDTLFGPTAGFLLVCQYGPGGNIPRQYPFKKGAVCSACPIGKTTCDLGLCA